VRTDVSVTCSDDAINHPFLILGSLSAAVHRQAVREHMLQELRDGRVRILGIDWSQGVQAIDLTSHPAPTVTVWPADEARHELAGKFFVTCAKSTGRPHACMIDVSRES
jgi:hypothetical protein